MIAITCRMLIRIAIANYNLQFLLWVGFI